jgi:hypothetical protein
VKLGRNHRHKIDKYQRYQASNPKTAGKKKKNFVSGQNSLYAQHPLIVVIPEAKDIN